MFVLKASTAVIGVVSNIVFARMLSLEEYGVFAQVLAGVAIAATLVTCGTPSLLTRDVAAYHAHESWGYLKGLLEWATGRVLFVSAVLAAAALFWLATYAPHHWQLTGVLGLAVVLLGAINQVRAAILRGLNHVAAADFPDLVVQPLVALSSVATAYALSISQTVDSCLLAMLGGSVVSLILGIALLQKAWPSPAKSTKSEKDRVLWRASASIFFVITALTIVDSQIVILLVGYMLGDTEAGIFQACVRLAMLVAFGLIVGNATVLPKIAVAWSKKDLTKMQFLVTYAARNGAIFAFLTSIPLLLFPESFLGLFGPGYKSGEFALRILVLGQFVNAMSGPCGVILVMSGNQSYALRALVISVLVSVTLNFLLTPDLGLPGAAISVTTAMLIWNLLMVYWAKKCTGILSFAFRKLKAC